MRSQSRYSTAFSSPISVNVSRSGSFYYLFGASRIISFSYNGNVPDHGASGVCTTSITLVLANLIADTAACEKGDVLNIYGAGTFPDYTVKERRVSKYTTTVTAYDSCSALDTEFDNSALDNTDQSGDIKLYSQSDVLDMIRLQTGLGNRIRGGGGADRYCKDDLSGTCRSIMERMAELGGYIWAASGADITPVSFRSSSGTIFVGNSAEKTGDTYYSAGAVILTDTTYNVRYDGGYISGNIFKYIESGQVKGNAAIYSTLRTALNKSYNSFEISNAIASGTFTMPAEVTINSATKIALSVSGRYTPAGMLCDISAPELLWDNEAYKPKQAREDRRSVKKGEDLGCFFLNTNGSGLRVKL